MDIRNESDLFAEIQKITEASLVRYGIPRERQFTDEELMPVIGGLILIDAELAVILGAQK